jgi:hypothetical protein
MAYQEAWFRNGSDTLEVDLVWVVSKIPCRMYTGLKGIARICCFDAREAPPTVESTQDWLMQSHSALYS